MKGGVVMPGGETACMLIRYMDGTHERFEFARKSSEPTMLSAIGEALSANHAVLELADKVVIIPFHSIRSIEVSPPPAMLPRHAFTDVRLVE